MKYREFRAFIAIPLPDDVKSQLAKYQRQLLRCGIKASCPNPASLHLTLRFLGNIHSHQVHKIQKSMMRAAEKTDCFNLELGPMGGFPRPEKARILWVGLEGQISQLKRMAEKINKQLEKEVAGLAKTKNVFFPHLTYARVQTPVSIRHLMTNEVFTAMSAKSKQKPIRFVADKIILFESILKPSGAIHRTLFSQTF